MPLSLPGDYETLKGQSLALAARRAPAWGVSDTDYLGVVLRTLAWLMTGFHKSAAQADADALPTEDTSAAGLDRLAKVYGLSDGAGGYGRYVATPALGATASASGEATRTIPAGTQLIGPDGSAVYQVRADATIPGAAGTGQVTITIDAVTVGLAGNVSRGATLSFSPAPTGIDGTVTLITDFQTPGQDQEDDGQLLARLRRRLQLPPKSGAPQDVRSWGETPDTQAFPTPGMPVPGLRLYVFPNYFDLGTSAGVATVPGTGAARIPSGAQISAVDLFVNGSVSQAGQRGVGAVYKTLPPYMPGVRQLRLRCRVLPASIAFAFDWTVGQTVTPYAVSAGNAGTLGNGSNFLLELNTLAPQDLRTALAQGAVVRIQVDLVRNGQFVGPVIPEQVRVVALQDGLFNVGRTVLGLVVGNVADWASWIATGQSVYCGGSVVVPVAEALQALVNQLGPSRQSGLADPNDPWEDTLGINAIAAAAQNTVASDGITPLVKRAITGGVLIGVGPLGTLVSQDVQASDSTLFGPEILRAGRILVTD